MYSSALTAGESTTALSTRTATFPETPYTFNATPIFLGAILVIFETIEQRFDRLVFEGRRQIFEDGIGVWCPVGRHWWVWPTPSDPAEMDEAWLDTYLKAMIADHARCDEYRRTHPIDN